MIIVHIFENMPHHYINFTKFFVDKCSGNKNHTFQHNVIIKSSDNVIDDRKNQELLVVNGVNSVEFYKNNYELVSCLKNIDGNTMVIFHNLRSTIIWMYIFLSYRHKNIHWLCWGGDIYRYMKDNLTIKNKISKYIQGRACLNMTSVKALNMGDSKLISTMFDVKNVNVLPYPIVGINSTSGFKNFPNSSVNFLLGNSAAPSNNHIEIIDKVKKFRNDDVVYYMPLNYAGTKDYIDNVIKYGNEQLGEKFVPITEMLTKEYYDKLLSEIDCTIFAHERQQGLYVAYYMLLTGKKLFLKASTSSYETFRSKGIYVEPFELIDKLSFKELSNYQDKLRLRNRELVKDNFTEEALAVKWMSFFEDNLN